MLELLDEGSLTPSRLADLLLRQRGAESVLFYPALRPDLLAALAVPDAECLASLLEINADATVYAALQSLPLRRGSTNANLLFSFFGCELPDDNSDPALSPPTATVPAQYPLFAHQRRACREIYHYLTQGQPRRVLLHMPTGSGKTRSAMNVIALLLRAQPEVDPVVVWLAHTEELCEQGAEEFAAAWSYLGDRPLPVFRYFGPHEVGLDEVRGGILVAGLQKLYQHSLSRQEAFFRLAGRTAFVVMDEAHQAVAPTYRHLLSMLALTERTAILGLSATPGRADAENTRDLAEFFGRQKVSLRIPGYANPVDYLQHEGYLARVETVLLPYLRQGNFEMTAAEERQLREGLDLPESVVRRLAADHRRNFLILTHVMAEADRGGKVLVFACSVEHADLLADLLVLKGYRAAAVTGQTLPDRRRRLIDRYRDSDDVQILTNYGVLTTGFDAPRTNVAVITRPTQSVVLYSQMIGRAARGPRAGGNATCRVLTVIDQIPGFRSIAESFTYWNDLWTD